MYYVTKGDQEKLFLEDRLKVILISNWM